MLGEKWHGLFSTGRKGQRVGERESKERAGLEGVALFYFYFKEQIGHQSREHESWDFMQKSLELEDLGGLYKLLSGDSGIVK